MAVGDVEKHSNTIDLFGLWQRKQNQKKWQKNTTLTLTLCSLQLLVPLCFINSTMWKDLCGYS